LNKCILINKASIYLIIYYSAEARRRYEVFKEQTKAELRNTLDQILAGDESVSFILEVSE
jgi:hypothetical protein